MKKKLYMAVETDEYELPLYVADTSRELADWSGLSIGYVLSAISHGYSGKKSGMRFLRVEVELEKDIEERVVAVPEDIMALMSTHPKARKFFESLSYTDQKEYIHWIESTQNPETRARRIGIFIEKLKEKKRFMEK